MTAVWELGTALPWPWRPQGEGALSLSLHLTQEAGSWAPPLHGELTEPSISRAGLRGVGGPPGEAVNGA